MFGIFSYVNRVLVCMSYACVKSLLVRISHAYFNKRYKLLTDKLRSRKINNKKYMYDKKLDS